MGSTTMLLVWMALVFSEMVTSCSLKLRTDLRLRDETRLSKRWFSVGSWGVQAESLRTTWPEQSNGMHEIRYCFMEHDDYENLNDILQAAIKVWEPAFAVSSAKIVPSSSDLPPICESGDEHSLIIMSGTQQESMSLERSSSLGYSRAERENQLMFNLAMPGKGWPDAKTQRHYDVHSMAHELGHAMGLAHEHQRPDAWKYIRVQCKYLHDYDDVKELIDEKHDEVYESGDTIQRACTDMATAKRYDFTASEYMPYPDSIVGMIGEKGHSRKFDFDSIMLYESYQTYPVQRSDFKWTNGAVLIGQEGPEMGAKKFELLPGGITRGADNVLDYSTPKISEGDMARIAQMYPDRTGSLVMEKDEWKGVWTPCQRGS